MANKADDRRTRGTDSGSELPVTPDEVRAFRLRAREIVNLVLEMADQVADTDAQPGARAECMARLASIYAKTLGVTAKHAARMTLIEALAPNAPAPFGAFTHNFRLNR